MWRRTRGGARPSARRGEGAITPARADLTYRSGDNAADPLRICYADDLFGAGNPGHVALDAQAAGLALAPRQDVANTALATLAPGLGAPGDTDPGSDAASGNLLARVARLLAAATGLATLLTAVRNRQPTTLLSGRLPMDALSALVTADTGALTTAAGGTQSVAANTGHQILKITNTGPNTLSYRFGAVAAGTASYILGPGQCDTLDAKCPTALVGLFSANGTTAFVTTGTHHGQAKRLARLTARANTDRLEPARHPPRRAFWV